jgi:MoxR-like ATPase
MGESLTLDKLVDGDKLRDALQQKGYIASPHLTFSLAMMLRLKRPLLLEGEAGVGKTSLAKTLSEIDQSRLIRLQCHEGLTVSQTLYEWNYQRQLLRIKLMEGQTAQNIEDEIYSTKYLLKRPLLQAISQDQSPVLLIDEIDRADDEFEAFLLELLGEFQVTIPELGSMVAVSKPHVILTSNGTRELSDALRRRCLYSYIDYPSEAQELQLIQLKLPALGIKLAEQLVRFVQKVRRMQLRKVPGIAETLDWAEALIGLELHSLDQDLVQLENSLICLLKHYEDVTALDRVTLEKMVSTVV